MWTEASDAELLASSALVVIATYTGQYGFSMDAQSPVLTLGVLQVEKVLKGDPSLGLVFIRVPNPAGPRKSDDIDYFEGQRGLWFLRADEAHPGLYLADHPQRFVPEAQQAEKLRAIESLLY